MKTQLYLTPADQGRALTLEEFTTARSQQGYHYEIIHGRLEVSPIPDLPHEGVRDWLTDHLRAYTKQRPDAINRVQAPARVFLPEAEDDGPTAPEPDVAGYQNFPVDLPMEEWDWQEVSPILVVEILSEDTADKDLQRNRRLYLQVPSIQEYWIVDPRQGSSKSSLLVYRRRGQGWARVRTVPAGGTYTTPLLPDFSLVVRPHA